MKVIAGKLVLAVLLIAIAAIGYLGIATIYEWMHAPPRESLVAAVPADTPAPASQPMTAAKPVEAKDRPGLCMSDADLDAYARYAAFQPIAFGADKCAERFPDLKDEADADIAALSKAHGATLATLSESALPAFTRSFGPDAVKRRDARLDQDQKPTFQRIQAYSRDECKSHLAAIESFGHMSAADFDNVLTNLVRQVRDTMRAAVPACG